MKERNSDRFWIRESYEEDGCWKFKCGNCANTWIARTTPDKFNHCPFCSITWWDGENKEKGKTNL